MPAMRGLSPLPRDAKSARPLRALAVLFVSAVALAGSACLDAAEPPEAAQLSGLYDTMTRAVADRDVDRLMALVAPDAEFTDVHSKKVSAAQYRADVKRLFARSRHNRIKFVLKNVSIDNGVANVDLDQVYRLDYRNGNGQWVPVVVQVTGKAQWRKIGGTWKLARSQELRHSQSGTPRYQAMPRQNSGDAFGIAHCYAGAYISDCAP